MFMAEGNNPASHEGMTFFIPMSFNLACSRQYSHIIFDGMTSYISDLKPVARKIQGENQFNNL